MIRLLFVGDGPRDAACLPGIVRTLIATNSTSHFRSWRGIRAGGYDRKLLFAIRVARDDRLDGVVAVVDSDRAKPRERLGKLRTGRGRDRNRGCEPALPTAVGEARPHLEAWLLDDPRAVCDALGLAADAKIPTVRQTKGNPKDALDGLISGAMASADGEGVEPDAGLVPALKKIADRLEPSRCVHARETGFEQFLTDVTAEFRGMTPNRHG